jgi:hypothetical protein
MAARRRCELQDRLSGECRSRLRGHRPIGDEAASIGLRGCAVRRSAEFEKAAARSSGDAPGSMRAADIGTGKSSASRSRL